MRRKRQPRACACGEHAFVACTRGFVALFDPEDAEKVGAWNWSATKSGHALRRQKKRGVEATVFLHHAIAGRIPGHEPDHIDGNAMNNRKDNLRQATKAQNQMNRHAVVALSGFKGVTANKKNWMASISRRENGVRVRRHLGTYTTKEEAARAYDQAARELFGAFARTNF